MKRIASAAAFMTAVTTALLPTYALSESSIEEAQRLYREHCKSCHDNGSENGEYTPMTLIQAQWERFFKRKYERKHRDVMDANFGGVAVTEAISAGDLEKISEFVISHAADTDQPMTCN